MKRLIVLIILICVTLSVWGQSPIVEIITPVSGKVAFTNRLLSYDGQAQNQLFILNTASGEIQIIDDSVWGIHGAGGVGGSPYWNSTGDQILYSIFPSLQSPLQLRLLDVTSMSSSLIREEIGISAEGWHGDKIITTVLSPPDPRIYSIYQLDLTSGENRFVDQFIEDASIANLPTLNLSQDIASDRCISRVNHIEWNPVYTDWIMIEIPTHSCIEEIIYEPIYEETVTLTFIYNISTHEILSINGVIGQYDTTYGSKWSSDGNYLFIEAYDGNNPTITFIVGFDPFLVNKLTIRQTTAIDIDLTDWLTVSDLFISVENNLGSAEDIIFYITQLNEDTFNQVEFFRLPRSTFVLFGGIGPFDWVYLGDEAEAAELSCIFDETLPTRLEIGAQAQVAFTDGTPSRLRSEPSTWGDVVQSLPEGTAFEIIGGYMCGSGYRWWQVQLADGTQGWIAEASETEYWIERRAS